MNSLNSTQFPNHDSHDEERLAGGLSALADYRMPPISFSPEAVVDAGHRRVRLRRSGTALGTAAVVAITAIAAWGATAAGHGNGNDPNVTSTMSSSESHTDPMTPQLAFGWLPGPPTGGFTWDENADFSNIAVENGVVNVSVVLEHSGKPEPTGTNAGTVNGHPAVWAEEQGQRVLVWRYKPDAWAYVLAEGGTDADMLKIADKLHIGQHSPIPLPMHLAALPHGFTVGGGSALRNTDTKIYGGGFTLCYQGDCSKNQLTVTADTPLHLNLPAATAPATTNPPPIHFSGKPAPPGSPIGVSLTIDGLQVTAMARGTAVQAIGGESGLTAFVKSMTWLGTDTLKWTTNVIG